MGKISVEVKPVNPVNNLAGSGHLLLIYTADNGDEFVIRGGPAQLFPGFGPIVMERGVLIQDSVDRRVDPVTGQPLTPADRGNRELDLGGRKAEDVWNLLLQYANRINDKAIDYQLLDRNSNTVARELLALVDIDLLQQLPTPKFVPLSGDPFLGINAPETAFSFDYVINGTDAGDRIFGRGGNQTLLGGIGNDVLSGGADNDLLDGGKDNDWLDGGLGNDVLNGGEGNDLLIASAGRDLLGGGGNADRFRFDTLPAFGAATADRITDFVAAEGDRIEVSRAAFGITAPSVSLRTASNAFSLFTALFTSSLFIYDTRSGQLWWNQNGTGGGAGSGGIFAILDPVASNAPTLTAADINLI